MMDEKSYKEIIRRLHEVDKEIKSLDPAIREASFKILQGYITGKKKEDQSEDTTTISDDTMEAFFNKYDHKKPSDNALLIAAYYYSQYGTEPLSYDEVKTISVATGLTIPGRVDVTLNKSTKKGKKLFTAAGKGKVKPTVHGESYFKEKYAVSRGKKKKEKPVE